MIEELKNVYSTRHKELLSIEFRSEYIEYLYLKNGFTKIVSSNEWEKIEKSLPNHSWQIGKNKKRVGALVYINSSENGKVKYRTESTTPQDYRLEQEIKEASMILAKIYNEQLKISNNSSMLNFSEITIVENSIDSLFNSLFKLSFNNHLMTEDNSKTKIEGYEIPDLNNTKDIDKVRVLILLNIVDDLHSQKYQHSVSELAKTLGKTLKIKHDTLKGYLNAYLNNPDDKNNPMNKPKEVNRVKIKFGIQ